MVINWKDPDGVGRDAVSGYERSRPIVVIIPDDLAVERVVGLEESGDGL